MEKQKNRYLILLVLALGAVSIYFLPYLRWTFYDSLFEGVGLTNTQFAATLSIYGVTSMIFYAPGGYLADKFSPRKMLAFAFLATAAGAIAIAKSYCLQFVAAPVGGAVADKLGSISFVVACCFVIIVAALAGFAFLPASPSVLIIAIVLMLLFSAGIFAMRGIYFATLDECQKVPRSLMGTAIGVVSVIGFFPDVYMNAIVGAMMDAYPGAAGYKHVFLIMLGFAVVGLIASVVLNRKIKKNKQGAAESH